MISAKPITQTQVSIVGAGLVGMAAAVAVHQAGYLVVLIDAKDPEQSLKNARDEWDQKIYAISPKNVEWLKQLGVWQHVDHSRVGRMQGMQIWADASSLPLHLSADEANQDDLALVIEGNALAGAFMRQIRFHEISTVFSSPGQQLSLGADQAILELENRTIESELLIAADGSHSWVRDQIGEPLTQKRYDQIAIVANFEVEKSHGNIARQWFAHDTDGQNSILAWLPLPDNRISIVWSVTNKRGQALLALDEVAFTQQVSEAGSHLLGGLKCITPPASFPLTLQTSTTLIKDTSVFIGDAAHQIHPLAGQGMNLGFRDVVDLMAIWRDKNPYQSIHDSSLLKRYSRVRKEDVFNMQLLTDGLYRLFANPRMPIKKMRDWGFMLTQNAAVKKLLVEKAIAL